ncbi:MAG: 26S protease regulatory subunit [Propionibacteriaceae bacterium]|nr:26S protease regulatory subunit [Propionibacteriaceae bacterium]
MDPEIAAFARTFTTFLETVHQGITSDGSALTSLGTRVRDFLGVELSQVDPVAEEFPSLRAVDVDLALQTISAESAGTTIGVMGAQRAHVDSFQELLLRTHANFEVGPVSYLSVPTGPDSERRVIAFGIGLLTFDGVPLVVLQRAPNRRFGRDTYSLEVLCPNRDTLQVFLVKVRALMVQNSVLRGKVISFQTDDYGEQPMGSSMTFLERPEVSADQVILPEGVLDRIVRHVVGIGENRETLLAAGQHLKRGVLLYGPPGTGKTHVVRHLLSNTTGTTAILLSGRTLALMNDATKLARATQPSMVVLEDCDLVAESRGGDTNAVLFETLEAMDGLDGDADVTFMLTTNRPDLLERALAERPGRVDLAVEIGKPDQADRERLLDLYASDLLAAGHISDDAISVAAERTPGVTASFAKELIRRCVIDAAREDRPPRDADLLSALDEMLSDAHAFTRTVLGGEAAGFLGGTYPIG